MDLIGLSQAQALHGSQPLGKNTIPLPIIYFVPFRRDYIQMSLFLRTPSESPKTLDDYIFFKSSLF
jgi:hypothetical protein